MTAVETVGSGSGTLELLAPGARRAGRAAPRGGARFQAQLDVAAAQAGEDKAGGAPRARRTLPEAAGSDDPQAPMAGPEPLPATMPLPDPPDQLLQGAVSGPPGGEAAPAGDLPGETAGVNPDGRRNSAQSTGLGHSSVPDGRATTGADGRLPAPAGPTADTSAGRAAKDGGPAPAREARPGMEGLMLPAEAATPAAGPSQPPEPTTPAATRPIRREGSAVAGPAVQPFRLATETSSAAAVRTVRSDVAPADSQRPADILVDTGGTSSAGIDVTIAAATPDLRDRFRAASDELRAELAEIGTGVDAIHVELRGDLGDGGAHEGLWAERGRNGDGNPTETARGEPDAAAWVGTVDPGQELDGGTGGRDADERTATASEGDRATGGDDSNARSRQSAQDGLADSQRLRLLLAPQGQRADDSQPRRAPAPDAPRRVDRYA